VNATGSTALFLAAEDGFDEIVGLLVNAGADVNATGNQGATPLLVASRYGRVKAVETLIAAGANVNASTATGWTALHHASKGGHKAVVELLIANGADRDRVTGDGWTARRLAKRAHHSGLLELLPRVATGKDSAGADEGSNGDTAEANVDDLFLSLRVPIWGAQMEAVDALVAAGPAAVPRLLWDLEDISLTVGHRKAAAVALGRIGDHRADEPLLRLVTGFWAGSAGEREAARRRQGLIPDEFRGLATAARDALASLGHDITKFSDDIDSFPEGS
jgi:hypothetical protein